MVIIKSTDDITHTCLTPVCIYYNMQEKTRKLEENARVVGLKINAKKTKLMYLNTERLSVIFVEGKQLDTVDSFNYLGSCIATMSCRSLLKILFGQNIFIIFLRLVLWKLENLLMSISNAPAF
jgi:hypothetical protein